MEADRPRILCELEKTGEPGVYTFVQRGQKDLLPEEFSGWLAASRHDGIAHAYRPPDVQTAGKNR